MAIKVLYQARLIDPLLDELLAQLPGLMIVGARTSGKTTTAARRARTVVRLDSESEAGAFEGDPDAALRDLPEPVLLDEWGMVPGALDAARRAIDSAPTPGRFLLTGSTRASLEAGAWPATGRLVRVEMHPMAVRELLGRTAGPTFFDRLAAGEGPATPEDPPDLRGYVELALRSGFPESALRLSGKPRRAWLESYVSDLLTHGVEQFEEPVTRRRDPARLRRYFEAYALNSAGVTDHRTIYSAAGINKVTATAYEGLLAGLLVAERVPTWTSNRLKRLVKQPKRYLIDPALIAAALRLDVQAVMRDANVLGRILDTFVAAQLRAGAGLVDEPTAPAPPAHCPRQARDRPDRRARRRAPDRDRGQGGSERERGRRPPLGLAARGDRRALPRRRRLPHRPPCLRLGRAPPRRADRFALGLNY